MSLQFIHVQVSREKVAHVTLHEWAGTVIKQLVDKRFMTLKSLLDHPNACP